MALRLQTKNLCDRQGLKYAWVAKQLGISRSHFDHIEAGRRKAPPGYYENLSRILRVPVDEIRPEPEPAAVA